MEPFIPFHFQVEMNRKFRLHHLYIQERAGTSTYIDTRTVFLSKYLKKGNYVLVPTMFQHGRTSEFLLRIFSEVPVQLRFSFLGQPCKLLFSALPPILTSLTLLLLYRHTKGQLVHVRLHWNDGGRNISQNGYFHNHEKFLRRGLSFRALSCHLRGTGL